METALVINRCMHFAAAILLFGSSFFVSMIARDQIAYAILKPLRLVAKSSILILDLTWVSWLCVQTAAMGDGWGDAKNVTAIYTVLVDTTFGLIWLSRLPIILLISAVIFSTRDLQAKRLALGTALLLVSLAPIGHPAMGDGFKGLVLMLNNGVHLLAAGLWLGGLPAFILTMRNNTTALRGDANETMRSYSAYGHFAVSIVLLTGAMNSALVLGQVSLQPHSDYQMVWLIKIITVLGMIWIAIINRYMIVPRLATYGDSARRALILMTSGEIFLGFCVVGLVSLLGQLEPM